MSSGISLRSIHWHKAMNFIYNHWRSHVTGLRAFNIVVKKKIWLRALLRTKKYVSHPFNHFNGISSLLSYFIHPSYLSLSKHWRPPKRFTDIKWQGKDGFHIGKHTYYKIQTMLHKKKGVSINVQVAHHPLRKSSSIPSGRKKAPCDVRRAYREDKLCMSSCIFLFI